MDAVARNGESRSTPYPSISNMPAYYLTTPRYSSAAETHVETTPS